MANSASNTLFFVGIGAIFASYLIKFLSKFENLENTDIVDTVTKAASSLSALGWLTLVAGFVCHQVFGELKWKSNVFLSATKFGLNETAQ